MTDCRRAEVNAANILIQNTTIVKNKISIGNRISKNTEIGKLNSSIGQISRWSKPNERIKASETQNVIQNQPHIKDKIKKSNAIACMNPIVKIRKSEASKKSQRFGLAWELYENGELYRLWELSGMLKYVRFSSWVRNNTDYDINKTFMCKVVNQMTTDYERINYDIQPNPIC